MRWILALSLIFIFGSSYADIGLEPLVNRAYDSDKLAIRSLQGVKGTLTTHRAQTRFGDTADPAIRSGIDMTGWNRALIYCDVGGTSPSWTVTPLYGDTTSGIYYRGQSRTVTSDDAYLLDVGGCSDFYIKLSDPSGNPGASNITIYVLPIN